MPRWRPLISRAGGMQTDVLFDADGKVVFRTQQEVDPVLDHNRVVRNHCGDGYTPSRDMKRVASIPVSIIHKWLTEEGIDVWSGDQQDRLAKKLNDPDYAFLRTAPGRLGPVGDGTYR